MDNLWTFSAVVTDNDYGETPIERASISYPPRLPLRESMRKTTVSQEEVYRPDKIAFRLYNNPLFSWVIDEANSFYSFKEYTINREIYYPTLQALEAMNLDSSYESFKDQNF